MSSSRSYLHLTAATFSEMKVDDNAMDVTTFHLAHVTTFHLALLYLLLIRDFPTPQHSIRLLLFPIEDVHPNGGIKKFKSSVYSNFVFSFRLRSKLVPQSNRSQSHALIQQSEMNLSANRFQRLREVPRGHLSRLQGIWSLCSDQVAVGLKTHSCCMCDRALSPVSLSTPIKTSSSSHLSESGSKAADPVGTSPEPTTKKPMRCTNLE
ncbi:hypothetical protein DY000_02031443 [Brassica cretica]|uniref:Uncharacterized protein n=1 Tax=Brassica cretica TaxID=69181 RepID=A0ABQ7DG00_BRACR|nr:hypothetical protein DY000_02031443 [Brassica cretica]